MFINNKIPVYIEGSLINNKSYVPNKRSKSLITANIFIINIINKEVTVIIRDNFLIYCFVS